MRCRGRLPAALVGLGVLLFAWVAQAQRVALVRPAESDAMLLEVYNRLSAELRLQDFEVAILDTGMEPRTDQALAEVARRTSSVAAVRFFRRGESSGVDVWFGPRGGGPGRYGRTGNGLCIRLSLLSPVTASARKSRTKPSKS